MLVVSGTARSLAVQSDLIWLVVSQCDKACRIPGSANFRAMRQHSLDLRLSQPEPVVPCSLHGSRKSSKLSWTWRNDSQECSKMSYMCWNRWYWATICASSWQYMVVLTLNFETLPHRMSYGKASDFWRVISGLKVLTGIEWFSEVLRRISAGTARHWLQRWSCRCVHMQSLHQILIFISQGWSFRPHRLDHNTIFSCNSTSWIWHRRLRYFLLARISCCWLLDRDLVPASRL